MSEDGTLQRRARRHEHDDVEIVSTPRGRALICGECRGPVGGVVR